MVEGIATPPDADLLVAWYGDDFTGAAAVMEVLAFAGLPAMLFLDPPDADRLARFPGLRAVGVASTARARTPEWMDEVLPGVFEALGRLGPALVHYKVCSTLDSSPDTGSIGRAIEIGAERLSTDVVPVLVAAPRMRRYQCFGHLFAGFADEVVRLDRHPVMSRHPVTPMGESDVALHLSRQSDRLDTRLVSLESLAAGAALPAGSGDVGGRITAVTIDSIDAASDAAAGRLLWEARGRSRLVVGSQGVEYALVEHWRREGSLAAVPAPSGLGRSAGMMSVSGSVSPVTSGQIAWSRANGFACIEFDATAVCGDGSGLENEIDRVARESLRLLGDGRDPLVHTAAGPDDPAVARYLAAVDASPLDRSAANERLGDALGRLLHRVLERGAVRRAVVSGGDTSGFALGRLGIYALSALAPTIPGAAIFRAHADGAVDGLELALKGGQMGGPDYFGRVRDGGGCAVTSETGAR